MEWRKPGVERIISQSPVLTTESKSVVFTDWLSASLALVHDLTPDYR
jgi:hypothetical protein